MAQNDVRGRPGFAFTLASGCMKMSPETAHCMRPFSIRVLVVEKPFREFLSLRLQSTSSIYVCWEASDGLEAVQKAEELQPDLILLDIGLPKLNGIEVARRIRKVSLGSEILFVSQEPSADTVREALGTGARGYIFKMDARRELLEGVNAVLRGKRFVGRRFSGHDFDEPPNVGA